MKNFSRIILAICVIAALSFAVVANAAPVKKGSHNMEALDNESLFHTGQMHAGVGYSTFWAGGFDVGGGYFFTDNISADVNGMFVSYAIPFGGTTSATIIDVLGVYHMAFADNMGWYAGIGFGFGSVTYTSFGLPVTVNLGGFSSKVGVEMALTDAIVGHVGWHNGFNVGVDMLF